MLYGGKDRPTEMRSHLEFKLLNGVLIIHVCESLTIQLQPPHDALCSLDLDLFDSSYFAGGGITSHTVGPDNPYWFRRNAVTSSTLLP